MVGSLLTSGYRKSGADARDLEELSSSPRSLASIFTLRSVPGDYRNFQTFFGSSVAVLVINRFVMTLC